MRTMMLPANGKRSNDRVWHSSLEASIIQLLLLATVARCSAGVELLRPTAGVGKLAREIGSYSTASDEISQLIDASLKPNHTITLKDGDIVKCVAIYDQPSFINVSNPEIENVKTDQLRDNTSQSSYHQLIRLSQQTYSYNSEICPAGTIPLRFPVVRNKGNGVSYTKESVVGYVDEPYVNKTIGTRVRLNVWNPHVEKPDLISLMQVQVIYDDDFVSNSIQAGWEVSETHYGDLRPRLSASWGIYTNVTVIDENGEKVWLYLGKLCRNIECPGFVQVSNKILLGGSLQDISKRDGIQYELDVQITQDPDTLSWWLKVNSEFVGYFPSDLFNSSFTEHGGNMLTWNGGIFRVQGDQRERTQMGSGELPDAGLGRAAYARGMQYLSPELEFLDIRDFKIFETRHECYRGSKEAPNSPPLLSPGPVFFYGGPGSSNPLCA